MVEKPCVTCKFYKSTGDHLFDFCTRFTIEGTNYVTGATWKESRLCAFVRQTGEPCGPDGLGWEQAPAPLPRKRSRLRGLLNSFLLLFPKDQ